MKTISALALFTMSAFAYGQDGSIEIHSRNKAISGAYTILSDSDGLLNSVAYFEGSHEISLDQSPGAWKLNIRYRLRIDGADDEVSKLSEKNLNREAFYLTKSLDRGNLKVGIQEITWGESLIFPILDMVNTRDFTYAKGFLDADSKQSNAMLNYEMFSDYGNIQLLYIPRARASTVPTEIGDFTLDSGEEAKFIEDHEYGFRMRAPSDFFDLSLYYLNHFNREPAIKFNPFSGGDDLILSKRRLNTFGLSSNVATETRIYKAELRHTPDQPISGVVRVEEDRNLTQSMFGVNQAIGLNYSLGLEVHYDNWGIMPDAYNSDAFASAKEVSGDLLWVGMNFNSSFKNGLITPQLILFKGVGNEDVFGRLKSDFVIADDYELGVELQASKVSSSSPKFILSQAVRLLLEFKAFF